MSASVSTAKLGSRREILFLYDIRMGNPNGDPDENRPRQLPDGTFYVTDVRLKRFAREYLKLKGEEILVDQLGGQPVDLAKRVLGWMAGRKKRQLTGADLVAAILDGFIDARLFGSSLAMKPPASAKGWDPSPVPRTVTGAVQFNHGEVLHAAEEVLIRGTSTFTAGERRDGSEPGQGTFTDYACLRYGLIGFSGVANEHSAAMSRMTESDYDKLLRALWNGVRAAGNTRTKTQQSPRLLIDVRYKPGVEYQIGNLITYVKPEARGAKAEPRRWASCDDYALDVARLVTKLGEAHEAKRIDVVHIARESDLHIKGDLPKWWKAMSLDD